MKPRLTSVFFAFLCTVLSGTAAHAQQSPLSFGVVSQRSAVLTAQYWNPILQYVSRISGVPLEMKLAKTGGDHAAMVGRGEFDFIYSNHNFTSQNDAVGYSVFARPLGGSMRGQLIVPAESPLRSIADLQDKTVVFPSSTAFAGYHVPMDALLRAGVQVHPQFAGTQEGALGQLVAGRAQAAGVNSEVARSFASQQKFHYRVLWSSEEFLGIPLSAHPAVPKTRREAVRDAFLNMAHDPEGQRILKQGAALVGDSPPYGFVAASNQDFDNIRRLYRHGLAQGARQ